MRSQTETPKRYRYTGKERDEESGLYYHGARYYAPWLGRWTSCDPEGISFGINLYRPFSNNPLVNVDLNGRQDTKVTDTGNDKPGSDKPKVENICPLPRPPAITVKPDIYFKYIQHPGQLKEFLDKGILSGKPETPKAVMRSEAEKAVGHASPGTLKKMGTNRVSVTSEPEVALGIAAKEGKGKESIVVTSEQAVESKQGTFITNDELMTQLEEARTAREAAGKTTKPVDYAAAKYEELFESQVKFPTPLGAFKPATKLDYFKVTAGRSATGGLMVLGGAADVYNATQTKSAPVAAYYATTASIQLTAANIYIAGWAAGAPEVMAMGSAIAAPVTVVTLPVTMILLTPAVTAARESIKAEERKAGLPEKFVNDPMRWKALP